MKTILKLEDWTRTVFENGNASSRVTVWRVIAATAEASTIFVAANRNSRDRDKDHRGEEGGKRRSAVSFLFFLLLLAMLHLGYVGRDTLVPRQEDPLLRRRLQALRDVHEDGQGR